ncbi:MAG: N-acetylmuramoyl-L-alanine amidase, partial [Acidobacteria bacterium]|nr:N-acetylmuramoyl-L-alanine amidase [Acidobacteriota bacterium]
KYQRGRGPIVVTATGQGAGTAYAATGVKSVQGYKPENVWLVETTNELERYSNGARILTKYEVDNHPRGYYAIPRGSDTEGDQPRHDIVGIVYHTSESDIVPFTADNNLGIQKRSQWLIEYIRRTKAYNYLIDRYGEIYRIVRDDQAAHHAGHSIWADSKYTYIGLNESFIGICFESSVNADSLEETLTEVQLTRGRELTHVLRSLYNIDDANCTTHGIVSVNPDKMLIAFHHDWVRNFPFEAMDLSDKYKILPPNISDYGFTYDKEILEKLGHKLWEGAIRADREFMEQAERARLDPELLRRQLRDRYMAQLEKVRKLRAAQDESGKSSLTVRSSVTNSPANSGNN